jgi:hypothetical protein
VTGAEQVKACCATAYGSDAVALVLGEAYHPGGLALTRRLADTLGLRAGDRVADIAAGPGATARLLAAEYGATVDGVDLGESTVEQARAVTEEAGLSAAARFHLGDAERLPLLDNAFDAVVCECAFCTFPDKATAATEFARVLRSGGRVGITDVTAAETLTTELSTLAAWVACIADARPLRQYAHILGAAGLRVTHTEPHDTALTVMIDQIEARVTALRMLQPDRPRAAGIDVDAVLRYVGLARRATADGLLGYVLMIAEKAA